jgi:voltage-gated potassium channel
MNAPEDGMTSSYHRETTRQAKASLALVALTLVGGTVGFYLIGGGRWSVEQCLYMTVITISTVGYGEVVPLNDVPHSQLFAILLILLGMGSMVFFGSAMVALVVERDLGKRWREKKMEKEIAGLSGHVIVCGAGTVGQQVIRELIATRTPFIVLESSEQRIESMIEDLGSKAVLYILGDATDDDTLKAAGIERARGIVVTLPSDKDSLIATVTARQMSRTVRIVSRCHEPDMVLRLQKAGANSVVSPNVIGGMRLVSEMIRPEVTQFLDLMLRDKDKNLRIEEAAIPDESDLIGKKLQETWIRKITSLLVIAVKDTVNDAYIYNPGPDYPIGKGTILILLGTSDDVRKLREKLGS